MDPLTAVSLTGNVIQFIDFSAKVVSLGREIYTSSSGSGHVPVELGSIIRDLSKLHNSFRYTLPSDPNKRSEEENNPIDPTTQCDPIHEELQNVLKELQVRGEYRKWKAFCAAVKSVWKENEINDLGTRLSNLQNQINSHIIVDIR